MSAANDSFVHLHVHSEYSMLDGAARVEPLMEAAVEQEMPAIAVTDHGNMFGAFDFWKQATDGRHQADHRHRGVRHARHRPRRPHPRAVGHGAPSETTSPAPARTPT